MFYRRGRCGKSLMAMQHVFDFCRQLPVGPKRSARLFFCLFPEGVMRIARLGERLFGENRLDGKLLDAGRLHVSLHHLGDYPRLRTRIVYAARLAGDAVSTLPFGITFHAFKSFDGARPETPRVLLGGSEGLSELHRSLGTALKKNGLRAAEHFVPHMTLSYGRKPVPFQPIDPIRVEVSEFALVHSKLWLGEYEVLERWPLLG